MAEDNSKRHIAVSLFFGAMGALVVLLSVVFVGYLLIDFSFLPDASCGGSDDYVYCFFDDKWDSETYLSVVSGFYSTIITILIFLLGTVAALAFIVIRGSAFREAEEAMEKEVDRYFESSKAEGKIHKWLEKIGGIELEKMKGSLDEMKVALYEEGILIDENLGGADEKKTE